MNLEQLIEGFKNGDKRALSKAITLVESKKKEHQEIIENLNEKIKLNKFSQIIGISGLPGVGKSTFIDSYASDLLKKGLKIAVLAIDPSSTISGGSILGDKTRMSQISSHDNIFIRPSPTAQHLGGVAEKTFETIKLCEKFGFDIILVETVGVGQSESLVSQMVDCFLLMLAPATGDDLQGMKRGVLEHADILVINKADGDLLEQAKSTLHLYNSSFDLVSKDSSHFKATLGSFKNEKFSLNIQKLIHDFFSDYSFKKVRSKQNEFFEREKFKNYINSFVDNFLKDQKSTNLKSKKEKFFKYLIDHKF